MGKRKRGFSRGFLPKSKQMPWWGGKKGRIQGGKQPKKEEKEGKGVREATVGVRLKNQAYQLGSKKT